MKQAVLRCICASAAWVVLHSGPSNAGVVAGVMSPNPAGELACVSVQLDLGVGVGLAGIEWFHNDGSEAFPRVLLVEGVRGATPSVDNVGMILEDVRGASLAWGMIEFEFPVGSSSGIVDIVFVFPESSQRTGVGAASGLGLGYEAQASARLCFVSGDGVDWTPLASEYSVALTPVLASGKNPPRSLASMSRDGGVLVQEKDRDLPERTGLGKPYPNPFNPRVEIPFEVMGGSHVTIRAYDSRGRVVRTLLSEFVPAGRHRIPWSGLDDRGVGVSSGVYFVRLSTEGPATFTERITLVR